MTRMNNKLNSFLKYCLPIVIMCSSLPVLALQASSKTNLSAAQEKFSTVLQPLRQAQRNTSNSSNSTQGLKSQAEVIAAVKSQYDGRVLKITLNEKKTSYSVRVLLPTGKVKNLEVNARK